MEERLVILIAQPGEIRDGLRALLAAMPQVESYEPEGDSVLSDNLLARFSERCPVLILVDCDIPGDRPQTIIQQIKDNCPQVAVLCLVDDTQQHQVNRDSFDRDRILPKGMPANRLYDAIMAILRAE